MTISNLPQKPENNINSSTDLHQKLVVTEAEIAAKFLLADNFHGFAQLAVESVNKKRDHNFDTENLEALATTMNESEEWLWFDMTDESKWEDEEERSELAEIEEDRRFYITQMCI